MWWTGGHHRHLCFREANLMHKRAALCIIFSPDYTRHPIKLQPLLVQWMLKACHNTDSEHLAVFVFLHFSFVGVILTIFLFSEPPIYLQEPPLLFIWLSLIWVNMWSWCFWSKPIHLFLLLVLLYCLLLLSLRLCAIVLVFKAIAVAIVLCLLICLCFCHVFLLLLFSFVSVCGEPSNPSSFCYGTTAVQDDAAPGTQEYIMLRQDSIHSADIRSKGSPFRAKCHEIFCCPLKQVVLKENAEPEGLFAHRCFVLLMLLISTAYSYLPSSYHILSWQTV